MYVKTFPKMLSTHLLLSFGNHPKIFYFAYLRKNKHLMSLLTILNSELFMDLGVQINFVTYKGAP